MRPKLEKINLSSYKRISLLDHNETSAIWFGWVFHEIRSKISFSQSRWKISLMELDEWKSLKLSVKKWFYELKCVKRPIFHTFTSFLHFTHFDGKQNLRTHSQSSHFTQIHTNSHSNSLLLLSKAILHKLGIRGRKWGVI